MSGERLSAPLSPNIISGPMIEATPIQNPVMTIIPHVSIEPALPSQDVINLHDIPLHFVPYERGELNASLIHTADHEAGHYLLAQLLNENPLGVSLERQGNILGQTFLSGSVSSESFKIIAAGGAASSTFGPASGFGSDFTKISLVDLFDGYSGGSSIPSAVASARGLLNSKFTLNERRKIAQIMAYIGGFISQETMDAIISRARLETMLEQSGNIDQLKLLIPNRQESSIIFKLPEEFTIISDVGNHTLVNSHFKDGKFTHVVKCILCGGEGGHSKTCLVVRNKNYPLKDFTISLPENIFVEIEGGVHNYLKASQETLFAYGTSGKNGVIALNS